MHPFGYSFCPFLAFFLGFCKYKDVIHVNDEPSFGNYISEGGVHEGLEGWQRITLAKEHNQQLIEAIRGDEHSLPLISFLDVDVVIPPSYVHFGEVFGSIQSIDEGRDEGERIHIPDSMFIEIPIVLARVKPSVLLLNEEGGGLR